MGGPQISRYVVVEIRAWRLMLNRWKILPVSKLVLISRMDKKWKKVRLSNVFCSLEKKLNAYISLFLIKNWKQNGTKVFMQNIGRLYQILVGNRFIIDYKNWHYFSYIGGFQLLDLIIPELKSHVIPYKFKCSHWWKIHL